jgi:lysophospholipase L1-like esterase
MTGCRRLVLVAFISLVTTSRHANGRTQDASAADSERQTINHDSTKKRKLDKGTSETRYPEASSTGMVLTLGDSYSAGVGLHAYDNDFDVVFDSIETLDDVSYNLGNDYLCIRELDTIPGAKLAQSEGMQNVNMACMGANTDNVVNQINYANAIYPSLAATQWKNSVIVLTVGANDGRSRRGERLPAIMRSCVTELKMTKGCNNFESKQITNYDDIERQLYKVFELLASTASEATIRVLGYPRVMQPDADCDLPAFSKKEAQWIDDQIATVNKLSMSAMGLVQMLYPSVDIDFVDVEGYFTSGCCDTGNDNELIRGIVLSWRKGLSTASFHPSQLGYDTYYEALLDSL